jgi:hypothetical protein
MCMFESVVYSRNIFHADFSYPLWHLTLFPYVRRISITWLWKQQSCAFLLRKKHAILFFQCFVPPSPITRLQFINDQGIISAFTLMKFYCFDVCKVSSIPQEFSISLHHRQFIQFVSHAVLLAKIDWPGMCLFEATGSRGTDLPPLF